MTNGNPLAGRDLLRLLDLTPLKRDVADPWYTRDFDACWDDVTLGCRALLERVRSM